MTVWDSKFYTPEARPLAGVSICFDLDGTLVHTAPDLVRVTNEIIALEGVAPTDYRLAARAVGFGSRRLLCDAFARAGHSVSEDRLTELQRMFLLKYAEDISRLSRPYRGVEATLQRLAGMGAELSVCTNKPGWLARPLLEQLGMTHHFVRIVGGDEAPRSKPDPRHIFMAAGHRDRSRIVMVGDASPDMDAAHNARVLSVLMTYGYSYGPQIRLRAGMRLQAFRSLIPALAVRFAGDRPQ